MVDVGHRQEGLGRRPTLLASDWVQGKRIGTVLFGRATTFPGRAHLPTSNADRSHPQRPLQRALCLLRSGGKA